MCLSISPCQTGRRWLSPHRAMGRLSLLELSGTSQVSICPRLRKTLEEEKAGHGYAFPEGKLLPRQGGARPLLQAVTSPKDVGSLTTKDPRAHPVTISKECIQTLQTEEEPW